MDKLVAIARMVVATFTTLNIFAQIQNQRSVTHGGNILGLPKIVTTSNSIRIAQVVADISTAVVPTKTAAEADNVKLEFGHTHAIINVNKEYVLNYSGLLFCFFNTPLYSN